MRFPSLLVVLVALSSCASNPSSSETAKRDKVPAKEAPPSPVADYSTWGEETIALPPEFAPEMQLKGEEKLLFAPGMFKAEASDFFSYAFVLRYPNQTISTPQLVTLLEQYYRGLMTAVAEDKSYDMQAVQSVQVTIVAERESTLKLQVETFDSFVTGKAITLDMQIERQTVGADTCILAQVAPSSAPAEIWPLLAGAAARLSCQANN